MTTDSAPYAHQTVLLSEAVEGLGVRPSGHYVDATFGRGGHARAILEQLGPEGRLLGIDKDPLAEAAGRDLMAQDGRFRMARGSFADVADLVAREGWEQVDGILADLGVSSPQLDDPDRGFSFMHDGPLDMRMDPEQGLSASEWLGQADEQDIANIIYQYGEERFSRRIARRIVEARAEGPIATTAALADLVAGAVPRKEKHKHPATRTFQAIRIHLNRELADLEHFLSEASALLSVGGRLVVISFHSLEDRMVKRFMRDQARGPVLPRGLPVTARQQQVPWRLVGKAVKPGQQEVQSNVRARSAVMRVLEHTG